MTRDISQRQPKTAHTTEQRLDAMEAKLDKMSAQIQLLVDAQRPFTELASEMGPIAHEVLGSSIEQLQFLEERGYFAFVRELKYLVDRLVEDYDPADLHQLADNAANILDSVRALTQPPIMAAAREAAEAFSSSKELEPIGLFGAYRAIKNDPGAQRGLAFGIEILSRVGRSVARSPRMSRKELGARSSETPAALKPAASPANSPAATAPYGSAGDDSKFISDSEWNRGLAMSIGAQLGVQEMTDAHWNLVQQVRAEYTRSGSTPNIRKLTSVSGVSTREVYSLFPKAPGQTLAKIAGVPKPVGCL